MSVGDIGFEFRLRPLDDIEAWESDGRRTLHWFGLTDGLYRVTVGGKDLFEYDSSLFERLGWQAQQAPEGFEHGAEYQVARLFHDLAGIVPLTVDDPVPESVARHLATTEARAIWSSLVRRDAESDEIVELLDRATGWLDARSLDSGHLRAGPLLRLWRSDARVHAWCDNRGRQLEGHRVWAHDDMYAVTSVEQFDEAVASFREHVLGAMDERVRIIEAGWTREGVEIDVVALREQQSSEAASWERVVTPTDWGEVSSALSKLAAS
ncbi:MAG: hypothetical protein JKY37_01155 [Nannocystaceae bacterium]|nr:hypothetical protein [Nannocystaceae bacterium]